MMTCKQASLLMSTGAAETAPAGVRLALRIHLVICRACRRFQQHLANLAAAARERADRVSSEAPDDLAQRVIDKMRL